MIHTPSLHYIRHGMWWFSAVILVFVLGIDLYIYYTQRNDLLAAAKDHLKGEVSLFGEMAKQSLIRNDYTSVEQFVQHWGRYNDNVSQIVATMPNGFELSQYQRAEITEYPLAITQHVLYEGRKLITIFVQRDITSLERHMNIFAIKLLIASVIFATILGAILWFTISRAALQPIDSILKMTIKALEDALEESVRANTSKSKFLANVSHELRTPLNAVIGYSELLIDYFDSFTNDQVISDIKKIKIAGEHQLALINDVLDLAKVEAGKLQLNMQNINVKNIINEIVDTVYPSVLIKNNKLQVDIQDEDKYICVDGTKFRQIFFNILSNACKFTDHGQIRITARQEKKNNAVFYNIEVSDTGIGMNEEQLNNLFKEFMQGDPTYSQQYGGSGLGLAISQRLCALMGGSIEVTSEKGQGSTFSVSFPSVTDKSKVGTESI